MLIKVNLNHMNVSPVDSKSSEDKVDSLAHPTRCRFCQLQESNRHIQYITQTLPDKLDGPACSFTKVRYG